MSGGESGTVGSALVTIVRRLFRWASADETSTSGAPPCVVYDSMSSSFSTQHIESDLNGNLSSGGCRNDDVTSAAKDVFHESRYRRSLGHRDPIMFCRRCGVAGALQCEATLAKQSTFVCGRCRKLAALGRRDLRLSVDVVDTREQLAMAGDGGGGEPVCCCDRCSTVSSRLLRLPSNEFQSKFDTFSSASTALLVPASSPPTTSLTQSSASLDASVSPILRRRQAMLQAVDSTEDRLLHVADLLEDIGEPTNDRRPVRVHPVRTECRPPVEISVDLPPSIPVSPDGEEGYSAYRRCLAVRNQAVRVSEASLSNGRAPPNVTIRHLTDHEKLTNLDELI